MGKSHNEITFEYTAKQPLTSFDFKVKNHFIGLASDWDKTEVSTKGKQLIITIKADRKGNQNTADFFNNFVNEKTSHMIHTKSGSNKPDALNFAITGTLTINNNEFELCIGQGHYALTNNWHLCSESILAQSDHKGGELRVKSQSLANQLYLDPSGSDKFIIKEVNQLSGLHDNDFKFKLKNAQIDNIQFELEDGSITVGQPFSGVTTKVQDGAGIVTIKAGRNKSEMVARWFDRQVDQGSCISSFTTDQLPGELNFGIKGTLKFKTGEETIIVKNCVLGQGSNLHLQNNWWLGGPQMKGLNLPVLGGGLGMIGFYHESMPKLILCTSILDTNEVTLQFINLKKEVSSLAEFNPAILDMEKIE